MMALMAFLMDFARLSFFLNRDFEEAFFCGTHERKSSGKLLAAHKDGFFYI